MEQKKIWYMEVLQKIEHLSFSCLDHWTEAMLEHCSEGSTKQIKLST